MLDPDVHNNLVEVTNCNDAFKPIYSYFSATLLKCPACDLLWLLGYYEDFTNTPIADEWGERIFVKRHVTEAEVAVIERHRGFRDLDISSFGQSEYPRLRIGRPTPTSKKPDGQSANAQLSDVAANLLHQLRSQIDSNHYWIMIVGDAAGSTYMQFLTRPDRSLVAEFNVEYGLETGAELIRDRESQLRQNGWSEPAPPDHPNWYMSASAISGIEALTQRAIEALQQVLMIPDDDEVLLELVSTTWEPARKSTSSTSESDDSVSLAVRPTCLPYKSRKQALTIERKDGQIRVLTQSGRTLFVADAAKHLIEKATKGRRKGPFDLAKGSVLTLNVSSADRAQVLAALRPAADVAHTLAETYEDLRDENTFTDLPPTGTNNRIDGEPWGWMPHTESLEQFGIVPMTMGTTDLATFSAWMSGSMTGAVMTWGARLHGATALIWYSADESEPGTSYMKPLYEITEKSVLLDWIVEDWIGNVGSGCPACVEVGNHPQLEGWVLDLWATDLFSESEVGQALAQVWTPCDEHRSQECEIRNAESDWHWVSDRWLRSPS